MLSASAVEPPRPDGAAVVVFLHRDHYPMPLEAELHEVYELTIVLEGSQERHHEGFTFVIRPGDVCLSAAWEPHGWRALEPETFVVSIHFLPEFLGDEVFDENSWLVLFATEPRLRSRASTDALRAQALSVGRALAGGPASGEWHDVRRIQTERGWREQIVVTSHLIHAGTPGLPPAWQTEIRLHVLMVLLRLYQSWHHREQHLARSWPSPSRLARVMPAVHLCLQEASRRRVSGPEAAAACALGLTRFRDLFRATMGISFGRFELRHRLAAAAQSFLNSDLSVEAVAHESGFTDGSHLCRAFEKHYGKTPLEYRAQHGLAAGGGPFNGAHIHRRGASSAAPAP